MASDPEADEEAEKGGHALKLLCESTSYATTNRPDNLPAFVNDFLDMLGGPVSAQLLDVLPLKGKCYKDQ